MKININNLSESELELWQFYNQPQKRLLAYVDRLYQNAYDEYGNCLGSIDTWNCKKDCAYLDSVNGVSYYGRKSLSMSDDMTNIAIEGMIPYYFIANRKYWGMIEERVKKVLGNTCKA